MRRLAALVIPLLGAFVVAGCGSSNNASSSSTPAGPASTPSTASAGGLKISSATIAGLGPVLVDARGRTLYMFAPDKAKQVTCTGTCASVWPPAFVRSGQKPVAAGSVKPSLLGSDPDPAGGRVVTYHGWPLYTYVSDTSAGHASGQAVNLNGGLWYVISPAGKVIKNKP